MKKTCLSSDIGEDHKLLSQTPVTGFLQSFSELSTMEKQRAFLWFIGYAYRLRNALFHEIIDPLDAPWQLLFKSAYLVLKHVVDINIFYLKMAAIFVESAPMIYEQDFRAAPRPKSLLNRMIVQNLLLKVQNYSISMKLGQKYIFVHWLLVKG